MNATTKHGAVNYKRLLLECKELGKQGRKGAYALATKLTKVFADDAFRQDIGATDDFAVADALSEYTGDLCLSFLELRTLLEEFPQEEEWAAAKSLAKLYDDACQRISDRKPEDSERTPITRNRITREAHEKVVEELKDRNARLTFVEKQVAQSTSTIDQLRNENSDLKMENERLKGRIEELERLVRREFQAA